MTEQNSGARDVEPPPAGRHASPDESTTQTRTQDEPPTTSQPAAPASASAGTAAGSGAVSDQATTAVPAAGSPADRPTDQIETPTQVVSSQPPASPPPSDPATRQMPEPAVGGPPVDQGRSGGGAGRAVRSVARRIAMLLRLVGGLFALILVVFILLAVVEINEQNAFAQFIGNMADVLVLEFRDLFLPADERVRVGLNYGLAAVFWVVVSGIAASVVQRLAALVR